MYEQASCCSDGKQAFTSAPTHTSRGGGGTLSRVLSANGDLGKLLLRKALFFVRVEGVFAWTVQLLEPSEQI